MVSIQQALDKAWAREEELFKHFEKALDKELLKIEIGQMARIVWTTCLLSQNLIKRIQAAYEGKKWTIKIEDVRPKDGPLDESFKGYEVTAWIENTIVEQFMKEKYESILSPQKT